MKFKIPISIQKINPRTEELEPFITKLYANINKDRKGNEYLEAGAVQSKHSLVFEVRYREGLRDILFQPQLYLIIYQGHEYQITDYDDFQEQHKTVKLLGVHV